MNDHPRPWKARRPGVAATRGDPPATHTLAIFDISDDATRTKVGEMCKDYGLKRFQWSSFEGPLSRNKREELFDRARLLIAKSPGGGRLLVIAIGDRELAAALRAEEKGTPVPSAGSCSSG
jgi:CRISPR-associated protein Cas2